MQKANSRKLAASVALAVASVALLLGLTFAWFTDSVKNEGNRIQAGTLGIAATVADVEAGKADFTVAGVNGGNAFGFSADARDLEAEGVQVIAEDNWEPGQSDAKLLTVSNDGTLATKVKLQFDVRDAGLQDALWFDFIQVKDGQVAGQFTERPMGQLATVAENLEVKLAAGESIQFILVYGMDESAGNEYQGKSFEADVTILATQDTVEADGFGNTDYDAGATYPVTTADELADAVAQAQDGDTVSLTGDIALASDLNIAKSITIDGNGSTLITNKPVSVAATANVTFNEVNFADPTNASNNASSVYANGLQGKLVLKGCTFTNPQWDAIQITPVAGAEVVIDGCSFELQSPVPSGNKSRFIHIEADPNSNAAVKVSIANCNFGDNANMKDDMIGIYYVNINGIDFGGNNTFVNSADQMDGSTGGIYICGNSVSKTISGAEAYKRFTGQA